MRTHTEEKHCECEECEQALRYSLSLVGHMTIHTSDKAYMCKKCGRTSHVMKWKYGCPNHMNGTDYEYLEASLVALAQAVSTAGQMVSATGLPWLQTFLANMEK